MHVCTFFIQVFVRMESVCQYIQLFHLINKMQMEGLYTFSSQQLQDIIKRPSSTDTPPNIRKRIITSTFSKKQSLLSQASTREDILTLSNERKTSTKKKVAFLMEHQPLSEDVMKTLPVSHLLKTRSLVEKTIKQGFQADIYEKKLNNRYPLPDSLGKVENSQGRNSRCNQDKVIQEEYSIKMEPIQNKPATSVRQKRTFSLKLSPKIVPISDRRLPKAFKIKYVATNTSKQLKKKADQDSEPNEFLQDLQYLAKKSEQYKVIKRSRFQEMFSAQRQRFESLIRPQL